MKRSFASWFWALCLLAAATGGARADLAYIRDTTPDGEPFLVVSGIISSSEDFSAFSAAVATSKARAATFNSPGGNIHKALELGRLIRKLDLETFQSRSLQCVSACAFAFLGGVARYAEPGAIGVHKTWFVDSRPKEVDEAVAAVQQITAEIIGYIVEMGADPALLEVVLSYDSNDMRYLSGSEMAQFRVVTDEQDPAIAGAAAASLPPEPAASASAAAPGAHAMFYQEPTRLAEGTQEAGTVVWSLVRQSRGDGARPEPVIRGEAVFPGGGMALSMTITRNADRTIPASHIIEMIFTTPDNFDGGGIDDLLGIAFKQSELAAGDQLLGVPVKIEDGCFLVALNAGEADVETNLALFESDQWIDVWVIYKSGRRALMTLEKGAFGNFAFSGAVNAWPTSKGETTWRPRPSHSRVPWPGT
jgi:hypothetical protein